MNHHPRTSSRLLRHSTGAAGAALLLTALTACGSNDPGAAASATSSTPAASTAAASGTLDAVDQSGDGTTVSIASVDLQGVDGGWVAIHQDLDGKPGPVVGTMQVPAGSSTDVEVPLDANTATGSYWPMLHVDDHTIGTYEFPKTAGADLPVKSGADIVMKKITLTVS